MGGNWNDPDVRASWLVFEQCRINKVTAERNNALAANIAPGPGLATPFPEDNHDEWRRLHLGCD